jgi:signal transduction histidine kinase
MLKLHQLYLRKFIILFIVLFISVGVIIYFWVKAFYISQTKISLQHNIELVSYGLDNINYIDNIAKKIKKDLNLRLTVVNQNGLVVSESHQDKKIMDNHKYREEIVSSNTLEFGSIIRYSETINRNLLYVVKRYKENGQYYYIRVARELDAINKEILVLGVKVLIVLALFFIALFYMAYKMSLQVQNETNKILQFLLDLTKKRKNSYISSSYSDEFSKITKLLTKVSQILTKKDKQKSKYTAKLKASNSQKDDIISAISHEFKNPIAVINGYTQTLLDDKDINKNIQEKFLKKINNNGNRLSELIDTLRLSIKLDEGKQPLNYKVINLHDFLEENIENLKLSYKNREVQISGAKDISVKVDETLFSVAVTNLVENALKYSEDNVKVNFTEQSIDVIDSGVGISEDNINKITNKFYRVSNNGWNNSLGLGLSIVSNIINMHNFVLDIKSIQNEGSTFTIHLKY